MTGIPEDGSADATRALLADPYRYISGRCRALGADAFQTRLMLSPVVCASGVAASEMFYRPGRFTRRGAMPKITQRLLQDVGSVQALDGAAHRQRKAMFLAMVGAAAVEDLGRRFEAAFLLQAGRWPGPRPLIDAVRPPLAVALFAWAGLKADAATLADRTRECVAMVDGAGSVGPPAIRGLFLRRRTERWARSVIADLREGRAEAPPASPVYRIAHHVDAGGARLGLVEAGVELVNLIRPVLAVDRYLVHVAHALHLNPQARDLVREGWAGRMAFAEEVRRLAPFFPFVGGRVLEPFAWRGHEFRRDDWVLLDLYGTNRDPAAWPEPDVFRPERFIGRIGGLHDLVPQGGGDRRLTHRCPGEDITLDLMARFAGLLADRLDYAVPPQDLEIDLSRLPAGPRDGFVMDRVSIRAN